MTCPRCGNSLENGARFCGVCGHRVDATPPPLRTADPPASAARSPARPATPIPGESSGPRAATSQGKNRAASDKKLSEIAIIPSNEPVGDDPYIGTTLSGRFTVEKKLGEGGFGAVYNGIQLLTGRKVAIKLLHPEMTRDQNVVARFRREGQVLCSLRDAHTITTYDFDQTADGTLFIAMELLEGRSLHDVFHDEAPIAWQRMLKVMSEMCSSLEEAHTLGIVHRDLKPENIYLENRPGNPEFVKILDFGIAKVMRGDASGLGGDMSPQLTATGQTLGTLEYMSPEQLMGKPLDGRSDIYGLGVVAFEMLTGRLPFPDAVGPAALISAQLKKTPPVASQVNPGGKIPPVVDKLILKMLAKDKNQRFRDVGELRREIEEILSGAGRSPTGRPGSSSGAEQRGPSASKARPPATSEQAPERQARSSWATPSRPPPASAAGPVFGGPSAVSSGPDQPSTPAAVITARSASPPPAQTRGPVQAAGVGLSVSPGHTDPPWAGGARPAGSSIQPGSPGTPGRPRASAGPQAAALRELVHHPHAHAREHEHAQRPRSPASSPPWMWITVAGILFLAIVIGGFLATR
jgi:serine/threonine-protein kinase